MTKVLFIEDDPEQIFLFSTFLKIKGYSVVCVSSEAEVMKALADEKPDLILSDIILRGENGLDILEKLKQDDSYKGIPVFIFTNTNKKDFQERAKLLGADDFIIKSDILPNELVDKINNFFKAK